MRFDVPTRLADGREAVGHSQTYVSVCQRRGFTHPDLTGYPGQLWGWYDGEDGLDLAALDDDCAALWATVGAAEEALRVQRGQLDRLAAAWRGPGSDRAARFLRAHCDTGAALTARLRGAAAACDRLRDDLWRLIDEKVAAAVEIDDRVCAQRPEWLAAAGTDSSESDDVIDRQVIPYVANAIAGDWLAAMRATRAGAAAAYETATVAAEPESGVVFPIPDVLGPDFGYDGTSPSAYPTPSAPPAPAEAADDRPDLGGPADAGLPEAGQLPGGLGSTDGIGVPGGLAGLAGLVPRIVDAIGSLFGPGGDGLTDPFGYDPVDDKQPDTELVDDEDTDPDADAAEAVAEETAESGEPEPVPPAEEVGEEAPAEDPAAAPLDQPVAAAPAPSDVGEKTPCEIAADELPQVGE